MKFRLRCTAVILGVACLSATLQAQVVADENTIDGITPVSMNFDFGDDLEVGKMHEVGQKGKAGGCDCGGLLSGLLRPSDHCFDRFISPMTNPVFFEDPRTLTEARFIFMNHIVPARAGGGSAQLYAMQVRAALTDRLSIVAAKDGYVTSTNPLVLDGWANVSAGLKYNIYKDYEMQRIASIGAAYEMPVGSDRTQQGYDEFHVYATAGTQIGCNAHWLSAAGLRLPPDSTVRNQLWYWSNHFDYMVTEKFYALTEFNWYHWMSDGTNLGADFGGVDLFNLGGIDMAGNDVVTGAVGMKYKPSGNMELGVAWEVPLSGRRDILDNRLTVDCILRY